MTNQFLEKSDLTRELGEKVVLHCIVQNINIPKLLCKLPVDAYRFS